MSFAFHFRMSCFVYSEFSIAFQHEAKFSVYLSLDQTSGQPDYRCILIRSGYLEFDTYVSVHVGCVYLYMLLLSKEKFKQ